VLSCCHVLCEHVSYECSHRSSGLILCEHNCFLSYFIVIVVVLLLLSFYC